jgi:hypothetical protein
MSLRTLFMMAAMAFVLAVGPSLAGAKRALAQAPEAEASPAPLGPAVVEDSLAGPSLITALRCTSGRAIRDFSDESLTVRVSGRCGPNDPAVSLGTRFPGVTVPDGEIRLEARTLAGTDRLSFRLAFWAQQSDGPAIGYRVHVDPGPDTVTIVKQTGDTTTPIARRNGIGRRLGSGEWVALSVRFEGPRIWFFLDDALVLSASDDTFTTGEAGVFTVRLGSPDDDVEVAVAMRNVRVSGLAVGDPERLPQRAELAALPTPPGAGEVILDDALSQPLALSGGRCPTGLGTGEFAGEGFLFKTRGRCRPENTSAFVTELIRGLSVLDGDLAVSFKIVNGSPRTAVGLNARLRDRTAIGASINPATGFATLLRAEDGNAQPLARRTDAHRLAQHDDWNRLALRMRGAEAWMLLNDHVVLHSDDGNLGVGGASVSIFRDGNVDDEQEAAVVFADLRVSALEDGDPARWPSYRRP